MIDNRLSSHLQLLSIVRRRLYGFKDSLNVQTTVTLISKVTANRPSRRRSTYTLLAAVLSIAALAIDSPLIARGQATSGAISGFVTDNVGAAIPQAKVSVKDEGTNVVTEATTDGSGFYNVTNLIAGNYTVTVTANGFKTFSKQHILLQIDSAIKADAHLDPGMVTQEVTVTAAPAALKTEKTDVDHLLEQHEIETIPVQDDNLTTLYLTAPGVVPFTFQISTNENPSEGFMTSVNGQLWMANDYQVNGITDIAWGFTGLQIIVPPPDSVQELKITTADYDPVYGNVGGMVAQYDTKSGTNDFHGSAYWMNRNCLVLRSESVYREDSRNRTSG